MAGETVLIIDDSRLYREVIRKTLIESGYDVNVAECGEEGVDTARMFPPDLIITDMDMPGMSGEDVTRALKADPATQMIPIVMFTGTDSTDLVEQIDAGADDYLPKQHDFRELKAKVKAFLRIKALQDQVVVQNERLRLENEANERELGMAREVQGGLIPQEGGRRGRVDFAFRYIPTRFVSGDLFDVVENADGSTGFFISDVSGHGVKAALVTAMVKTGVHAYFNDSESVGQLVGRVNNSIANLLLEDMFVTAFFGKLYADGAKIEYVNAGHLPVLIVRAGTQAIDRLESDTFALGVLDDTEFDSQEARVGTGDRVFLYTDGIIEAAPPGSTDMFGFERFEQSVLSRIEADLDTLVGGVIQDLIDFSQREVFEDDLNLVAFEVVEDEPDLVDFEAVE